MFCFGKINELTLAKWLTEAQLGALQRVRKAHTTTLGISDFCVDIIGSVGTKIALEQLLEAKEIPFPAQQQDCFRQAFSELDMDIQLCPLAHPKMLDDATCGAFQTFQERVAEDRPITERKGKHPQLDTPDYLLFNLIEGDVDVALQSQPIDHHLYTNYQVRIQAKTLALNMKDEKCFEHFKQREIYTPDLAKLLADDESNNWRIVTWILRNHLRMVYAGFRLSNHDKTQLETFATEHPIKLKYIEYLLAQDFQKRKAASPEKNAWHDDMLKKATEMGCAHNIMNLLQFKHNGTYKATFVIPPADPRPSGSKRSATEEPLLINHRRPNHHRSHRRDYSGENVITSLEVLFKMESPYNINHYTHSVLRNADFTDCNKTFFAECVLDNDKIRGLLNDRTIDDLKNWLPQAETPHAQTEAHTPTEQPQASPASGKKKTTETKHSRVAEIKKSLRTTRKVKPDGSYAPLSKDDMLTLITTHHQMVYTATNEYLTEGGTLSYMLEGFCTAMVSMSSAALCDYLYADENTPFGNRLIANIFAYGLTNKFISSEVYRIATFLTYGDNINKIKFNNALRDFAHNMTLSNDKDNIEALILALCAACDHPIAKRSEIEPHLGEHTDLFFELMYFYLRFNVQRDENGRVTYVNQDLEKRIRTAHAIVTTLLQITGRKSLKALFKLKQFPLIPRQGNRCLSLKEELMHANEALKAALRESNHSSNIVNAGNRMAQLLCEWQLGILCAQDADDRLQYADALNAIDDAYDVLAKPILSPFLRLHIDLNAVMHEHMHFFERMLETHPDTLETLIQRLTQDHNNEPDSATPPPLSLRR